MALDNQLKHWHHIIPKHMGGSNDTSNLVQLTIEEHAEAHRKLYEQHGMWQDEIAWKGLAGIIGHEEAVARACASNKGTKLSEERKAARRAYRHTEGAKRKIGMANIRIHTGKKHSEQAREKMRISHLGITLTEEHKKNISISLTGELNPGIKYRGKSWIKDPITNKRIWIEKEVA